MTWPNHHKYSVVVIHMAAKAPHKQATKVKVKAMAVPQVAVIKLKVPMGPLVHNMAALAGMDLPRRIIIAVSETNVLSPCLSSFTDSMLIAIRSLIR